MKSQKKQEGTVLIIGTVMLLILSVIVIASGKTTMLQQKMSNNLRDRELAFQSAETAIRTGEKLLQNSTKLELKNLVFDSDGTNGYYSFDIDRALKEESDWSDLNTLSSEDGLYQVKEPPVYIIENIVGIQPPGGSLQVPKSNDSNYYRITSKAKGGTDGSLVVLQSIYKK